MASRYAAYWALCIFLGVMGSATAPPVWAQSTTEQEATEQRLRALREQIQRDQTRLSETVEEETATQQRLEQLRREIALRGELAATYQQRLDQLSAERDSLRTSLDRLTRKIRALKQEYRRRATHAYKHGRLHDMALILAAQSINQMLVRVKYLHRFADARREQLQAIQTATADLRQRREALQQSRQRTEELLADVQAERAQLRALQAERRKLIETLRAKRSDLRETIAAKQAAAQKLEAQIRAMANQGSAADNRTPAERAAYEALSASFAENRGQLPWPTEGVVTESYGNRVDPVYGTVTRHPGILIATNPGAAVRAVFSGTVAGVDFVPGYGTYLVIRHGDYLSVYSNFSDLYVTEGQSIEAGQLLGRAGTEDQPRGAGLFFAVFDKSKGAAVDPRPWLRNR